jgi:hypothetical protein
VTRLRYAALTAVLFLAVPLASATPAGAVATEQSKPAAHIVADAEKAMMGAKSFHVRGYIDQGGEAISLNLSMSPNGGGGTVQLPGVTMQLVVAAQKVYVKADEKSWLKLTGSKSTAELVANRWIEAPASNADFANFAQLADSKTFMAQLTSGNAKFSKVPATANWGGHKALVLKDNKGDRLYVADATKPYMLHLQGGGGGSSGYLTFSDFGTAPMPSVPANAISFPSS